MQNTVRIENYYGKAVQATVLEEVRDGILKGWNHLQMPDGSRCYMARRWCLPMPAGASCASGNTVDADDTDWRKFLREHWDAGRNHCRVECLDEFMAIFTRAAAACMRKKPAPACMRKKPAPVPYAAAPQRPMQPTAETAKKSKRKPRYVQPSLFG